MLLVVRLSTIMRINNKQLPEGAAGVREGMREPGCPSRHTPAVQGHSLQKGTLQWRHMWSSGWWPDLGAGFPVGPWDIHPGQESKCNGMRIGMGATCSCWQGHKETSRVSSHINYFMSPWECLCFPGNFGAGVGNSLKLAEVSGLHVVGLKNLIRTSFTDTWKEFDHTFTAWSQKFRYGFPYEYSLHVFKRSKALFWEK